MPEVRESGTHVVSALSSEEIINATGPFTYPFRPRGWYVLVMDMDAMQAGDSVTLRWYRTDQPGEGSLALIYQKTFEGADGGMDNEKIACSFPVPQSSLAGFPSADPTDGVFTLRCTIEQTAGTLRSFPYSLELLATRSRLLDC